jgi:putative spermidine/putrescine transport system permease protein
LLIGHVITVMPYVVGSVSSALAGLERSLEDAARSLGAGPWRTFRSITLPLISPGMIAGIVFGFVVSFGQFDVSLFLSTPDLEPLPVALYQSMRFQFDPTIAASGVFAVVQLIVSLLIINHVFGLSRLTKSLLR